MLAEVARRRSWLRSLATIRRVSQLQATARPHKEDGKRPRGRVVRRQSQSLNFHLQLHAGLTPVTGLVKDTSQRTQLLKENKEQVKVRDEEEVGAFSSLISSGSPALEDLDRAHDSLHELARDIADPREAVWGETGYQRERRQLKATTRKLDVMLYNMRKLRDFEQVEAVAFVWDQHFPQFASQRIHWIVICEHYALALNSRQRFQDVVDKFSSCFRVKGDDKQSLDAVSLLTPRLAQSIFVALGHLRDATGTLQLLDTMRRHNVTVSNVSYFHALLALLHDERFTDFEIVMQVCEGIATTSSPSNVPLSLLPMIMMTAAARGESKRAMKFYCHPPDTPMTVFTQFHFEICLQQLHQIGEDAMLMEMYRNFMKSATATHDVKERVSKYLFRKRVAIATSATRNKCLTMAFEILEIMNEHKIRPSHHAIYPLIRALILEPSFDDNEAGTEKTAENLPRVETAEDIIEFFSRYSHSLEWNPYSLCESIVAGICAHRVDLVDSLFVYALSTGMPIKYAALEQVVVYYYRLGLINDFERISVMVHALRLNKHIPLGISVTEIGMAANLRLHRYEEVVMLFEDFSSLDGKRKRVLERRFMLKTVLKAYKCLGRGDEAMAIQALLGQTDSTGSLLGENVSVDGEEVTDLSVEYLVGEDEDEVEEKEQSDDSDCEGAEEILLPLRRFNR